MTKIRPRDFLETRENLHFAAMNEKEAYLRYYPDEKGERSKKGLSFKKVASTDQSFEYLSKHYPAYLLETGGRRIQHCPPDRVIRRYSPAEVLTAMNECKGPLAGKCLELDDIFSEISSGNKGVTGSISVGLETAGSDIDFVIYGRENFDLARKILITAHKIDRPTFSEWHGYFKKRFPDGGPLSFEEFLWHEGRKNNLGRIEGTLFNLLMVGDPIENPSGRIIGPRTIICEVTDSEDSFNLPARYEVDHPFIKEILSFTHTYAGQAEKGETILARGILEESQLGKRLIIGTTRETKDEYIKVLK